METMGTFAQATNKEITLLHFKMIAMKTTNSVEVRLH